MGQLFPVVQCFLPIAQGLAYIQHNFYRTHRQREANLELGMALVQQNINDIDVTDVAMLLELLTDLGTDGGYGDIEGVHCLDFG